MVFRPFPRRMRAIAWIMPALLVLALATVLTTLTPGRALAMKIQQIKTPGGITAWLVEEHSVPLIAMRFAFEGGSAQDPAGKEGLANFLSGMLDEGAGDMKARQFQEGMEEIAMRMSFEDGRDAFYGSFETLTENRDTAIALLALAINKPRFDTDAVDRIRQQLQASLVYAARDPEKVASKEWYAVAFEGHTYARSAAGTEESLNGITSADLADYKKLARKAPPSVASPPSFDTDDFTIRMAGIGGTGVSCPIGLALD